MSQQNNLDSNNHILHWSNKRKSITYANKQLLISTHMIFPGGKQFWIEYRFKINYLLKSNIRYVIWFSIKSYDYHLRGEVEPNSKEKARNWSLKRVLNRFRRCGEPVENLFSNYSTIIWIEL